MEMYIAVIWKIPITMVCGPQCTWGHRYSGMRLPNRKKLYKTAGNRWMPWNGCTLLVRYLGFRPGLLKEETTPCTIKKGGGQQMIQAGTGSLPPAVMKPSA